MSLRICVLASGSRGNCTWIATERTRLLIDAGLSKRETYRRLRAVGEGPAIRSMIAAPIRPRIWSAAPRPPIFVLSPLVAKTLRPNASGLTPVG